MANQLANNDVVIRYTHLVLLVGLLAGACTARQTPQTKNDQIARATSDSVALAIRQGLSWSTAESTVVNRPRPLVSESRIEYPRFPPERLFGVWVENPAASHADFWLDADWFYAVAGDAEGNRPYSILDDSITIYFPSYSAQGRILRATGDTLVLTINGGEATTYFRWREEEEEE